MKDRVKLTPEIIKTLVLPPGKDEYAWWDTEISGFGYRIRKPSSKSPNGARSWVYMNRVKGEVKQFKFTIGNADKMKAHVARSIAKDKAAEVHHTRENPQEKKKADRENAKETFGAMVTEYIDVRQADVDNDEIAQSTFDSIKLYLEQGCASLHPMRLDKVGRPELAGVLAKIKRDAARKSFAKSGRTTEARAYAALSGFYVWCIGTKGVRSLESSPLAKINKPDESDPDHRVLTPDELRLIWKACGDDDYGKIIKILMLTLKRRAEVGNMRWSEIDADNLVWRIPGRTDVPGRRRTKNKSPDNVPLVPKALEIIESASVRAESLGLFGKNGFTNWDDHLKELNGRIAELNDGEPIPHWGHHCFRHTADTIMGDDLDILPHVTEALLNHKSTPKTGKQGVAGIYNKAEYMRQKRDALLAWADYLLKITGDNVVRLPRGAGRKTQV